MSVTSTAPNSTKGGRYLSQLDQALCNAEWSQVSELARKTEKHAPQRKCFTLAARTEAQIGSSSPRAASANSQNTSSLRDAIPGLTAAISAEERYPEDAYVARICLAEIHWLQNDLGATLKALPQDSIPTQSAGSRAVALGWLEVCEVKAEFFRVVALQSTSEKEGDARKTCLAVAARTPGSRTAELRRWTERLLARTCLVMSPKTTQLTLGALSESLRCFNTWADFWQRCSLSSSSSLKATNDSDVDIPQRRIWKTYYNLLSLILQHGLLHNPSPSSASDILMIASDDIPDDVYARVKAKQRSAMKKVEMAYESLLLNETQFPKASQTNIEVEEWIQQAVSNWRIFNGPNWADTELGEGGKETLSRGILDVLYRAATKTFHSTAILRYLLELHASLGEFDLALHAFNSYVEIISKEKARAERSGAREPGGDSADTAVLTAVEAIRILCRYGDCQQAEKAVGISKTVEKWVDQAKIASNGDSKRIDDDHDQDESKGGSSLERRTLAAAYRAIGTAQAHWARLTYETDSRPTLQAEALDHLRLAHKYDRDDIETAYALALLLAEMRKVSAALGVIKQAIASSNPLDESDDESEEVDDYGRKRLLMPLWHLLALCLTAKDEYEQGARMCEAAFEQFGDDSVLFGSVARSSIETEKTRPPRSTRGLVDQMEGFEKENLLQIRISQLSFVELTDGPEAALDMSHELLSLYARLFGSPETPQADIHKPPPTAVSAAPSRLGGTLRSIAGSIRPRTARQSYEKDPRAISSVSLPVRGTPESSGTPNGEKFGIPIAITVTNEDGVRTEKSHHHRHLQFMRRGLHSEANQTLKNKRSFKIDDRPATPVQRAQIPEHSSVTSESPIAEPAITHAASKDSQAAPEQPIKAMEHNPEHDSLPPPSGHDDQPPRQDVRLPAPDPALHLVPNARLPSAKDRQQKTSLLIKTWLFIAGLYLRAELLDDAASAISEARELVESFEAEVASEHSSARQFYEKGWGGGKSVDALWADVFSASAYLAVARELPFDAFSHFEQALAHFPDHAGAIIGISNLLMDIYEEKIPAEKPQPLLSSQPSPFSSLAGGGITPPPHPPPDPNSFATPTTPNKFESAPKKTSQRDLTTVELNRLAARDRAYMLLSTLTRLGTGWDNSEAWYTLARAHELSKQIDRAKQALWWVVELEENEPLRPWREVGAGGFTL